MRWRTNILTILAAGLLLANPPVHTQAAALSEYQLKAAFIYNFAKFIEWPKDAFAQDQSPFIIGILGENPFGAYLESTVAGKKINEHPIKIQAFSDVADSTNCHILFVSTSVKEHLAQIVQKLQRTPVLTVGETEQFIETGGMVNFLQEGSKLRFQINDDAAKVARLKISSKLLGLAVPTAR